MPLKDPIARAEYNKTYQKKWYRENMEKKKASAKYHRNKNRRRNYEFVREIKESSFCLDCRGNFPYYVLQFDHVDDNKVRNISDLANRCVSLDNLKKEIRKCEIVCANCHAKRTHRRRNEQE